MPIKALVYGPPGVGKTLLCGTAATVEVMRPVLMIDVEGGDRTVDHLPIDQIERPRTFEDFNKAFWTIVLGKKRFATVIVDSLTELQMLCADHVLGIREQSFESDPMTLPKYMQVAIMMRRILGELFELDQHVLATAHERLYYPEGDHSRHPVKIQPNFLPSVIQSATYRFNEIWYLTANKGRRRLYTDETKRSYLTAKTRGAIFAANLGSEVESPTMAKIFAAYTKGQTK